MQLNWSDWSPDNPETTATIGDYTVRIASVMPVAEHGWRNRRWAIYQNEILIAVGYTSTTAAAESDIMALLKVRLAGGI